MEYRFLFSGTLSLPSLPYFPQLFGFDAFHVSQREWVFGLNGFRDIVTAARLTNVCSVEAGVGQGFKGSSPLWGAKMCA